MDVKQTLEYPLPRLTVSAEEIIIESGGEAYFNIKNSGGGTLSCKIISPAQSLTFDPCEWQANKQEIHCRANIIKDSKPGDTATFSVLILSNGGEKRINVTVKTAEMAVNVPDGTPITNIYDLYEYSDKNYENALKIFESSDFHSLLTALDFPYTEAYTLLVKDENKARAMDNFFILAGLKKETILSVQEAEIEHKVLNDAIIYNAFKINKSDNGYAEPKIEKAADAPWLFLKPLEDNTVKYSIDPLRIKSRYAQERINISSNVHVDIIFKRTALFNARMIKEGYRFSDEGMIYVESPFKGMWITVSCSEYFVRFYKNEYKISEYITEIPFIIKLSALQTAQMMFRRIPSLKASINLTAEHKNKSLNKTLMLTAGEW